MAISVCLQLVRFCLDIFYRFPQRAERTGNTENELSAQIFQMTFEFVYCKLLCIDISNKNSIDF